MKRTLADVARTLLVVVMLPLGVAGATPTQPAGKVVPESALDQDWVYRSRVAAKGQKPEIEILPTRPIDGPTPTVTIERPANRAQLSSHHTELAEMCGPVSECLLDVRDREVVVRVKDWPMSPNGRGVAIVVDNKYGMVVHDVSKPIRLDNVVPFPDLKVMSMHSVEEPVGECGWHFVAAFAVDDKGYGVKAPSALAVVSFFNKYERANDQRNRRDFGEKMDGAVIVNLPLMGRMFEMPGRSNPPFGWRTGDPLALDYYVYQPPTAESCSLYASIYHTNETEADVSVELSKDTGLMTVRNLGDGDSGLDVKLRCQGGDKTGVWSEVQAAVVAHQPFNCVDAGCRAYRQQPEPRPVPRLAWPLFNGKNSWAAHDRACTNEWLGSASTRHAVHRSWCEDHRSSPKCAGVR